MLDLIRLPDDRWLARAATARQDGTPIALEEILVCKGMPNIEAVIDRRDGHAYLVLRERRDPDHVLAERAVEPVATAPLRVVWDASDWDAARATPRAGASAPIVPA